MSTRLSSTAKKQYQTVVNPLWVRCCDPSWLALALTFRVPLVDRTGTISSHISTRPGDAIPRPASSPLPLAACMDRRADELLEQSLELSRERKNRPVRRQMRLNVLWSGGIDSTAILASLMQRRKIRHSLVGIPINVVLNQRSIRENPSFFNNFIRGKIAFTKVSKDVEIADVIHKLQGPVVTGECGDQLFGSAVIENVFAPQPGGMRFGYSIQKPAVLRGSSLAPAVLARPWHLEFLPVLHNTIWGLKHNNCKKKDPFENWNAYRDFEPFIQPLLDQAPFKIHTLYDFLWWINFTSKWNHVKQRIFIRNYVYRNYIESKGFWRFFPSFETIPQVINFYDDTRFQQWALDEQNHNVFKMPDKRRFADYKLPLKKYIHDFAGDEAYFRRKVKIGSLQQRLRRNVAREWDGSIIEIRDPYATWHANKKWMWYPLYHTSEDMPVGSGGPDGGMCIEMESYHYHHHDSEGAVMDTDPTTPEAPTNFDRETGLTEHEEAWRAEQEAWDGEYNSAIRSYDEDSFGEMQQVNYDMEASYFDSGDYGGFDGG